jgi:hypothetical protein
MHRLILLFGFLGLSITLFAQPYKDSIKLQFLRYTDLIVNKDFARSAEYLNPEFFEIVPKAQLITILEKTFENPDFDFKIENPVIISIGDNKKLNGNNFVKLQYSNYLSMHFKQNKEQKQDTAATKKALEAQFGEGNVTYTDTTDSYKIFVIKNVIANSANMRQWTFVVVEDRQKQILEKFIPKELL